MVGLGFTLLKFPMIRETAKGSSANALLTNLPIPSGHGISFIILRVMGLVLISTVVIKMNISI